MCADASPLPRVGERVPRCRPPARHSRTEAFAVLRVVRRTAASVAKHWTPRNTAADPRHKHELHAALGVRCDGFGRYGFGAMIEIMRPGARCPPRMSAHARACTRHGLVTSRSRPCWTSVHHAMFSTPLVFSVTRVSGPYAPCVRIQYNAAKVAKIKRQQGTLASWPSSRYG